MIFKQIWRNKQIIKLLILNKQNFCNKKEHFIDTKSLAFKKYLNKLENEYYQLNKLSEVENNKQTNLNNFLMFNNILEKKKELLENLKSLEELSKSDSNKELNSLIDKEKLQFLKELKIIENNLVQHLLNFNDKECSSIALEITAGVGGKEAMLFANELFQMYCHYLEYKNWSYSIEELDASDLGGIRHSSIFINGYNVYNHLKNEGGVHRVQRIPSTEKAGRIHTSTVTVAILPQNEEINILIKEKDLKIETKKASGAGGQHVNTTDSAVRIVHIPTGLAVECQTERSQIKNREIALRRLKAKLYQINLDESNEKTQISRKQQVGLSLRNEKIRTYNYNQDRITDHRIENGTIYNLKGFLEGKNVLDEFIQKINFHFKKELLKNEIKKYS